MITIDTTVTVVTKNRYKYIVHLSSVVETSFHVYLITLSSVFRTFAVSALSGFSFPFAPLIGFSKTVFSRWKLSATKPTSRSRSVIVVVVNVEEVTGLILFFLFRQSRHDINELTQSGTGVSSGLK